jgi:hypothetical protein
VRWQQARDRDELLLDNFLDGTVSFGLTGSAGAETGFDHKSASDNA